MVGRQVREMNFGRLASHSLLFFPSVHFLYDDGGAAEAKEEEKERRTVPQVFVYFLPLCGTTASAIKKFAERLLKATSRECGAWR